MRPIREIFRAHAEVDSAGRHVNGTDKQTNHAYGDAYESLWMARSPVSGVEPWSIRPSVNLMMEVGVADGSSLLAWREVFPRAHCVGLDIMPDPEHRLVGLDRLEFHQGDMRRREDCLRAAAGRQFDFICEDATHRLEDTLLCLYWLWPCVRPGGLYVVEEWEGGAGDWDRVRALFPQAQIVDTEGPFGGTESLVVLRKPC